MIYYITPLLNIEFITNMFKLILDKIELICAIIIIAIIFYLGKQCGSSKTNKILPDKVVTITNYRDTIFPKDTFIVYKLKPSKPIHDTVEKPIYLDSTQCNRIYVYSDSVKTKEYDIYSKAHIQGILRNLNLKVKLKVPLKIHDSTIVKIDSLIYKPYKYEIHTGIIITPKIIAPMIDLSIDKCTYSIGYDPFNKYPVIGFKYRLLQWTPKHKKRK